MSERGGFGRVHPAFLASIEEPKKKVFLHFEKKYPGELAKDEKIDRNTTEVLESFGLKRSIVEKAGIEPVYVFPELGCFSAWVKPKDLLELLNDVLEKIISYVEPVPLLESLLVDSAPLIETPEAWSLGYTGKGVKIAIVDSGIWEGHPELRGSVVASKSFVEGEDATDLRGHGTHVAGIAAGRGATYRGVAFQASLINAKVLDKKGYGGLDQVMAGVMWAVKECGADIVNMSLGEKAFLLIDIEAAIKFAKWMLDYTRMGVLFVAASGNVENGEKRLERISYPAIAPGVIAVGATDKKLRIADYSAIGSERIEKLLGEVKPTLVAPGGSSVYEVHPREGIISTFPSYIDERSIGASRIDRYHASLIGTSMAAPHVSGSLALLVEALEEKGFRKERRYELVLGALAHSARQLEAGRYEQGYGFINIGKALKILGKYSVKLPDERSIDGLRNYLRTKREEAVEALASTVLETAEALIGLGMLGLAVASFAGETPQNILKAARLASFLKNAYDAGVLSRERYVLALMVLLEKFIGNF
jgi:subtilisin family serine protease